MSHNGSGESEEKRVTKVPPVVIRIRREATANRCVMFWIADDAGEWRAVKADGFKFSKHTQLRAVGYPDGWCYRGRYAMRLSQASRRLELARIAEEARLS